MVFCKGYSLFWVKGYVGSIYHWFIVSLSCCCEHAKEYDYDGDTADGDRFCLY